MGCSDGRWHKLQETRRSRPRTMEPAQTTSLMLILSQSLARDNLATVLIIRRNWKAHTLIVKNCILHALNEKIKTHSNVKSSLAIGVTTFARTDKKEIRSPKRNLSTHTEVHQTSRDICNIEQNIYWKPVDPFCIRFRPQVSHRNRLTLSARIFDRVCFDASGSNALRSTDSTSTVFFFKLWSWWQVIRLQRYGRKYWTRLAWSWCCDGGVRLPPSRNKARSSYWCALR
jgi:hypothetical protein